MSSSSSKLVIYAALSGNALIALTKFVAAGLTGSAAIFSEGIHSLVDTGNQVLLLHGLRRAARPADERFPFGYGKEIYFWSFVVAILIFALGAGVSLYQGIIHLKHPATIQDPEVNYIVLALSMVFEGIAWFMALRAFGQGKGRRGYVEAVRTGKDPSIFLVLFEDSAALLGLMVAFAGILLQQITGIPYFDGAASVVIGLILGATAVWLAYETKGLLIGERARPEVVEGIREIIAQYREIEHLGEVLTMHVGPDFILVNLGMDFRDDISASEVESAICRLDVEIKRRFPRVKKVFIGAEAHVPVACDLPETP